MEGIGINILIINQYSGSPKHGMEYRNYSLGNQWIKKGHKVVILTGSYSHLRGINHNVNKPITYRKIQGINHCIVKNSHYNGNDIDRYRNIGEFLLGGMIVAKDLVRRFSPDVVICSSTHPFDLIVGRYVKYLCRCKLVYEVHDMLSLGMEEIHHYNKSHPLINLIKMAEYYGFTGSDLTVSILPRLSLYLKENKIRTNRYVVIPNGIEIEEQGEIDYKPLETLEGIYKSYPKVISYCGGFAKGNAMEDIITVAKLMPQIGFLLVGEGVEKQKLIAHKERLKLNNLFFLDRTNKKTAKEIMKKSTGLYLGTADLRLYRYGVAMNKIYDYMDSGRPIIFATNYHENPIGRSGCGFIVSCNNEKQVMEAISRIAELEEDKLCEIGNRGKIYVNSHYNYKDIASRYIKILEEL